MKIYNGLIREISELDPDNSGHNKRRVIIEEQGRQMCEIEFYGNQMLSLLEECSVHDRVIIAAFNKGSRSKSGKFHNNIIAKSIKKSGV